MKKAIVILLALVLCMSMTACLRVGVPSDIPDETVDPQGEPVILLDEGGMTQENCYDENGTLIGYCQYFTGTNCDNPGTVRIDFLDLSGNVINTFSPKFAGGVLNYGQFGSFAHEQFEVTDIWESDYNADAVNSNSYILVPHSGGQTYAYIENRNGCTVRCDLFDTDGQLATSLTPNDPSMELEISNYEPNHFQVSEGYVEEASYGPTRYDTRITYYDRSGAVLCDFAITHSENPDTGDKFASRYDLKNVAGEILRTYAPSDFSYDLIVWYDCETNSVYASSSKIVYEPTAILTEFTEYFDMAQEMILFREASVFDGNTRVSSEYVAFNGKVEVTENASGVCEKVAFYDAQGNLQKTVEAPKDCGIFFKWESSENWIWIDIYDQNGNQVGYDTYELSQQ